MRTRIAIWMMALAMSATHAAAFTGCPGNGPTNSTVVAEYIFHEGSGTTAFNTGTGGDAGNAMLTNGVTFSSDVPPANTNCGYSASLPATGSGATTPALETSANYDPLAGATNFTIMAWVRRESLTISNNTAARIVSDISALGTNTSGFEFRFSGTTGVLWLNINGTERNTSVGGIAPNSNRWHHVAVVYDGTRPATNTLTRNVHFYVDGIQRGDGNTLTNVVVGSNTNKLTIGNSAVSRGVLNTLVGKLDDVRILRGFAPAAVGDGRTNATIRCFMNAPDDFEPPTITCPADRTVSTDPGQCYATGVALGTPGSGDNCGGTVSATNNAPAIFWTGTTVVTWTATDANGNSANCQQTVTVVDNEMPSITCPSNVTVEAGACLTPPSTVQLGQASAADNCGIASVTGNPPAQYVMGTNTVTWTVTDVGGNTAQCQQLVIVVPSATADCDGDGLTDREEVNTYGTNPLNPDTDADGLRDGDEVRLYDTDPLRQDTDGDGLNDGVEVFSTGSDPNAADTDGDGLPDGSDPNPTAANFVGTGLRAEYYDNADLTNLKLTRIDAQLNFDWGWGAPDALLEADTFSVRWSGQLEARYSETYTLHTVSDDGVRLWVNGQLLIDNWTDHAVTTNSVTVALTAGQRYDIRIEFYDNCCNAVAKLLWQSPSQPLEAVPQNYLYPGAGTGLKAEYYDNPDFTNLKVSRIDPRVDFDWGWGTPHSSMDGDTFSVRWSGQIEPRYSETYSFYTVSDDGVRLWVNGQLLVDNWTDHAVTTNSGTINLVAGQKYDIQMEFYDNCCHAVAKLLWQSASQPREVVPQSQLYPISSNPLGLRGEYYGSLDFTNLRMVRVDSAINFDWRWGSPAPGIAHDTFSVRWTGQIQPRHSETYTFTTLSDDGVRLWVNGQLVIDNWTDHTLSEDSGTITLSAGQKYDIKLEFYERFGQAAIKLFWQSASQPREIIPLRLPPKVDSDGDGLTDDEELTQYGTDPHNADTDGDGISDYEELFESLTNPLSAEFDGTVTDAVVKNGADISATLGQWQVEGTEIYALDRRGHVEYSVSLPAADVYRVEIEGREQIPFRTEPSRFDLQVYLNGEYLGRQTLVAGTAACGKVHLYTPYLQPGAHTVRIFWDNAASFTSLRIKAVRLQRLGGPDANGNGIKDWVESRLRAMSGIEPGFPLSSYISPAFIEGRGRWLSMMSVEAAVPGGTTNVPPQHGPGHRWYANVPLDSTNREAQVTISYQNGGLVETGTVRWVARNVLNGGTLTIRKGDSLLLTAAPDGATSGTVTITIGSTQYSRTPSTPVAHLFPTAGSFTVTGTYTPDQGPPQSGSLTVKVLEHTFSSAPAGWVYKTRNWDNFAVPAEAVFKPDPRLMKFSEVGALTNNGRRVSLILDQNESRHIASRIGEQGPILDSALANGFRIWSSAEAYIWIIQTYPDGSQLIEMLVVCSPVVPQVSIKLQIIVGGVTFDDGTVEKVLTAADFNALGEARVRFIRAAGVEISTCHTLSAYQGDVLLGRR